MAEQAQSNEHADEASEPIPMKGFLTELLQSRHIRLKIECLLLIIYTMYHCSGLVSVISNDLSDDDIDAFEDDELVTLSIACVLVLISVLFIWLFCALILTQYHYQKSNPKWIKTVSIAIKTAGGFWILSLITWVITVLSIEVSVFMFTLAIIPAWNKWLPLMLMYHIWLDLNPKKNTQERYKNKRDYRVRSWLDVTKYFICGYLGGLWIIVALGGIWPLILLFPIFTTFTSLIQAISNVEDNRDQRVFYCVCVPCCCCCYCRDGYGDNMTPQCCKKPQRPIVIWLAATMTLYWLLVNFLLNYNECLMMALIIEFATGFRGSALIIIFYCVMAALDLNYRGPIKRLDEIRNTATLTTQNNNNDNASNDPPIVVAPPASQSNDQAKMLTVREDSASADETANQPNDDNDANIR